MNPDIEQYRIAREPFYRPQGDEVVLHEAAYAARLPVMLKGPTGCGKSRFVEYMAWKLGRPLITVACNEDMTASDLVGRFLLDAFVTVLPVEVSVQTYTGLGMFCTVALIVIGFWLKVPSL